MKNGKRILTVTMHREADTDPDTSYLGEFSNRAESDFAINHRERSHDRRAYEWFNPANIDESIPREEQKKYNEQAYDRICALYKGQWCYFGISASARIQLQGDLTQTIRSGGLWGIESDSDKSYFEEVQKEELNNLREELKAIGFSDRAIDKAFENVQEAND